MFPFVFIPSDGFDVSALLQGILQGTRRVSLLFLKGTSEDFSTWIHLALLETLMASRFILLVGS